MFKGGQPSFPCVEIICAGVQYTVCFEYRSFHQHACQILDCVLPAILNMSFFQGAVAKGEVIKKPAMAEDGVDTEERSEETQETAGPSQADYDRINDG